MRYFDLIGSIDVAPVLRFLADYPHIYQLHQTRQQACGSPHAETESIFLRMPSVVSVATIFDDLEVVDWVPLEQLGLQPILDRIGRLCYGDVARAMIVKLKAKGVVQPHRDTGLYAESTDRYHLVIEPGGSLYSGDEEIRGRQEQLWWIDTDATHYAVNDTTSPRVHLIVDIWKC